MAQLIDATITEGRLTELFFQLPKHLTTLVQTPFSAATCDLEKVVATKKRPDFLHTCLYYSKIANLQSNMELVNSCNKIAEHVPKIWKYLNAIDPDNIKVHVDVINGTTDNFDLKRLNTREPYEVKLTLRYWAQQMNTLLLEIDSACRLAIKQLSRLVLCLFEVSDTVTSAKAAYTIIMHTQKLQNAKENVTESYIEFAKVYAKMMDDIIPNLQDVSKKMEKTSILFYYIDMTNNLIDYLPWLQSMLYELPYTTVYVWYQQFLLCGNWMNRLFIPWMKDTFGALPEFKYPGSFQQKGPVGTIRKALVRVRTIPLKVDDIVVVSDVLANLYAHKDLTKLQMDQIDEICIRRTGMTLIDWAVILDLTFEYDRGSFIGYRANEDIQRDIEAQKEKKDIAEAALKEVLRQNGQDFENAIFKSFLKEIEKDNFDSEEANKKYFPNMDEDTFHRTYLFTNDYVVAQMQLLALAKELQKPFTERQRTTYNLREDIQKTQGVLKTTLYAAATRAKEEMGRYFNPVQFKNYMDWVLSTGYTVDNYNNFKQESARRLNVDWDTIETFYANVQDWVAAKNKMRNLREELSTQIGRITRWENVFSVMIFICMGLTIFFIYHKLFPIYEDTIVGVPINATNGTILTPIGNFTAPPNKTDVPMSYLGRIYKGVEVSADYLWANAHEKIGNSTVFKGVTGFFWGQAKNELEREGLVAFDFSRFLDPLTLAGDFLRGAGNIGLTLLYLKAIGSILWGVTNVFWGVSTAFGNTLANGIFDNNWTVTWQTEIQNLTNIRDVQYGKILSNVLSIWEYHREHRQFMMMLGTQVIPYLGPAGGMMNAVGVGYRRIGQNPQTRNTLGPSVTIEENDNNDPAFNVQGDLRQIAGSRPVQQLTQGESDDEPPSGAGPMVIFEPPEEGGI